MVDITNISGLDKQDIKILNALSRNGRITWSDLAEEINLSLTPTMRRVKKLEKRGVIRGYTVDINQALLTGTMPVLIFITLERQVDQVLENFESIVAVQPEIVTTHLMSGQNDYLLHAYVRDLDHYRELLATLTHIEGIAHIHSSFILKTLGQTRSK